MKKVVLFLTLIIVTVVALTWNSNFSGECKTIGRRLSEEELFTKVLGEKYQMNPDCCYIESESIASPKNSFLQMLKGIYQYQIEAYYLEGKEFFEARIFADSCGYVTEQLPTAIDFKEYEFQVKKIAEQNTNR